MSDLRQAAQQALEAWDDLAGMKDLCVAMDTFRAALKQQAEPVAVYGYCPDCGAKGVTRERRPNGDDKCTNGHTYPSSTATPVQPLLMNHNGAVRKVHGYPPQQQAEPVAKYKVTVIDDHHPAGVPLEQWGKKQAEPVAWDKPSASFNGWWDSYHHDPANPFAEGLAAYWAWAGWKAAQRQWVGLTDEAI